MRREWLVRAIRTFVQAALGYAAANVTGLIGDGEGLTKNALAALTVAAGLAALMNVGSGGGKAETEGEESAFPTDDSDDIAFPPEDDGEGGGADE